MPIYEINGQRVEFDKEPSEADIEEAASQLGEKPASPDDPSLPTTLNLLRGPGPALPVRAAAHVGQFAGIGLDALNKQLAEEFQKPFLENVVDPALEKIRKPEGDVTPRITPISADPLEMIRSKVTESAAKDPAKAGREIAEFMTDPLTIETALIAPTMKMAQIGGRQLIAAKNALADLTGKSTLRTLQSTAVNLDEEIAVLEKTVKDFSPKILRAAGQGSLAAKRKLGKWYRSMSDSFVNMLDDAERVAVQQGKKLTRGDMFNMLDDAVTEASQAGVGSGRTFEQLLKMRDSFAPQQADIMKGIGKKSIEEIFSGFESGATVSADDLIKGLQGASSTEQIPFRALSTIKKAIRSTFSGGFRSSADDIPGYMFFNKLGKFMEKTSPELARNTRLYGRVIETMKDSARIFKPKGTIAQTKSGTDFIRRAAEGKLDIGEKAFLNRMEGGVKPFGPGVGQVSKKAKGLQEQKTALETTLAEKKLAKQELDELLKNKSAGQIKKLMQKAGRIGESALIWRLIRKLLPL